MKKRFLQYASVVVAFCAILSQLSAAPIGRSNSGRDYLTGTGDLSAFSAGIYFMNTEREVSLSNGRRDVRMESEKILGYVGYDVVSWLTAYIVGGNARTKLSWGTESESNPEYGVGLMLGLFDTEIEDPTFIEDRLRISGNIQYTRSKATLADNRINNEKEYADVSGSLTLSLVNDLEGDKFFAPNSIALFIGPAFSLLTSSSLEEESSFGVTAGMDVFINEKISFELAYISYEEGAYTAGLNIRF